MKKAKSENVASKKTGAAKEEIRNVNDPSEKIRSKEGETAQLSFKKTLYGYDPNEVESYIRELTGNYEASARNYEQKLSSFKEELALSNRERDSYGEKYRECKAKLENSTVAAVDNSQLASVVAEYKKAIKLLKDKLESAEAENKRLRSVPVQNKIADAEVYAEKIASLEKENRELKTKAEALERKNEELASVEGKYDALLNDYNSLAAQAGLMKAENEAKEKEISTLGEELMQKSAEIANLSLANDEFRKKLASLEAENGVLSQQVGENEKEIIRLKDINKSQAHEYADKINKLEGEQAESRLALQKEKKLRDYYINQAQATISELSNQMEEIRKTFTDTQSV